MTCTITAVPYPYTDAVTQRNLLTNPRAATALTGWGAYFGAGGNGSHTAHTVAGNIAPSPTGDGCRLGRMTWTTASTGPGAMTFRTASIISPGATYTAAVYAATGSWRSLRLSIAWYTAGDVRISTTAGADTSVTASMFGWTRLQTTGVAPGLAAYAVMELYLVGTAAAPVGEVIEAIAPSFTFGASSYFSGATSATVGVRYSWDGTADASTSARTTRTPTAGAARVTVDLITEYESRRPSASVLHDVIGRGDPAVTLGAARSREGRMALWCATPAAAHALAALYGPVDGTERVMMLRATDDPGLDMYHVATEVTERPLARVAGPSGPVWRWGVDVAFREVYGTALAW